MEKALEKVEIERKRIKDEIYKKYGSLSSFCSESGMNRVQMTNFLNGRYDLTLRNYFYILLWLEKVS